LVQFELSLHWFGKFDFDLNPELNLDSVQLGSGSNFSSEPNFSNLSSDGWHGTIRACVTLDGQTGVWA